MFLFGCSPKPETYANKTPVLDIRQFFQGKVEAWGILQNRQGEVTRRFHVVMNGDFSQDKGRLEESFTFDDGEKSGRVWQFAFQDDHHFTGTATDSVGEAKGQQFGNAMNMRYVLKIPVDDTTYDIRFDDWMYQLSEDKLINRASMTKFGIEVGTLSIMFIKG